MNQKPIKHIVFYGTLMTGAADRTPVTIKGLEMYNLGRYPGCKASEDPTSTVYGELMPLPTHFTLRNQELQRLDFYEGVPTLYTREVVPVEVNGEVIPAFIYLYADHDRLMQRPRIESGDWRNR